VDLQEKLSGKILVTLFVAVLAKLWLVEAHEIFAKHRPHDDLLFVAQAYNLLNGEWLGDFTNKTLIKGIGNPLFIAAVYWLGLPLLTAYHLLYAFACLVVVFALKPLVRQQHYLIFLFLLLLFNPFSYSYPLMSSTLRASLYVSLVLLCFGSMVGLWYYTRRSWFSSAKWTMLLSVSFTMLWITREEVVWIIPALVCFGLIYVLPWHWNMGSSVKRRLCMFVCPFILLAATTAIIAELNHHYYSVRLVNDIKSKEFVSALGGLMNIKPKHFKRHEVVSKYAQEKAFEVSPSFSELKPFLGEGRLPPSFYIWALRSATRKAGYYGGNNDANLSLDFYRRVGSEINAACNSGKLNCFDRKATLRPPWRHKDYNSLVLPTFFDLASRAINFNQFNPFSSAYQSNVGKDVLLLYDFVTGEHPARKSVWTRAPDFEKKLTNAKEYAMGRIGKIYRYLVPLLFTLAVFFHGRMLVLALTTKNICFQPVFGVILFGSGLSILMMLTFVKITLWDVVRPLYAIYPIVLVYIVWVLIPMRKDV